MKQTKQHIDVFIAYARKDIAYLEQLRVHLRTLDRNQSINIWYDGEIIPGTAWEKEIKTHLHHADIILLLLSAHSLASDYFHDQEMKEALERHRQEETIVIPVILSACGWDDTDLQDLQALPKNGEPIDHWPLKSSAYDNIRIGLKKSIEKVKKRRKAQLDLQENQRLAEIERKRAAVEEENKRHIAEAEQLQRKAENKEKEQKKGKAIKIAEGLYEKREYQQAKRALQLVFQLDDRHQEARQLEAEINKQLAEQRAASLAKLKSKSLKLGLPSLGIVLLFFFGQYFLTGSTNDNVNDDASIPLDSTSYKEDLDSLKNVIPGSETFEKETENNNEEQYIKLIKAANSLFAKKEYKKAKEKYEEALKVKTDGKEAKVGITKCAAALKPKPKNPKKSDPPKIAPSGNKIPPKKEKTSSGLAPPIQKLLNDMVKVAGGTFEMGCTSEQSDCSEREKPVHTVTLPNFSIGKYEVTQEQWRSVMGADSLHLSYCDQCPVEFVDWNDVQDFIKKLNDLTGKQFRLPTEAEWEFAARGGNQSKKYIYAGSNDLGKVAWYIENSGKKTHPVGKKLPNELGLYDMSGNVLEWCHDWYGDYSNSAKSDPKGPENGAFRVFRGGSWFSTALYCHCSYRSHNAPTVRYYFLGFRLGLSLQSGG